MGIWIFYLLALIPIGIGAILWIKSTEITWFEWLAGSVIGLVFAVIFQFVSIAGMTSDIQTISGYVTSAVHWPRWVEEYQQMHTRTVDDGTDSNGNSQSHIEIYYTTEYRTHEECWTCNTSIQDEHDISRDLFEEMRHNFGDSITIEKPYKSGFYSGDPNAYVAYRKTGYIYPVTSLRDWTNKVKASPSLFSFSKVPRDIDKSLANWPENPDWLHSNRLLGTATRDFKVYDIDCLNARIGASKKINVIIIGFKGSDGSIADWQRAKWIGGKKNDLVLCYGDGWSRVFGWSDSEICKRNIETILLNNPRNKSMLDKIEVEIINNYKIKDWSQFDYLTVEPPTWSIWVFVLVLTGSQVLFYWYARINEYRKTPSYMDLRYSNPWKYHQFK